jgi:hypothetical protein
MGQILTHKPVLLLVAAFSRYHEALDWAAGRLAAELGPIALQSARFKHEETEFYTPTMGAGLLKTFFAFEQLIDPARLVDLKHRSNHWETEFTQAARLPEERPLNLDPGYLTEAKLVLATTKDRDHRLYLDGGIYAEGTLFFHRGAWQPRPWTYPDYRRADYHQFFVECREYLRRRYRQESAPSN